MHFKRFFPGTCAEPSIRHELTFIVSLDGGRGMVAREPWLNLVSASYVCPTRRSFFNYSYGQYHAALQAKSRWKMFANMFSTVSRVREGGNED
jgi:hypothetical protein